MDYFIYDKRISCQISDKQAVIDPAEAGDFLVSPSGAMAAIIVKSGVQVISSDSGDPEVLEQAAAVHFEGDQVLQFEELSRTEYQVFAVERAILSAIKDLAAGQTIQKLVPYPAAIREFLRSQGQELEGFHIFLDDRGDEVTLTIINGERAWPARALGAPAEKMVQELVRTSQSYRNQRGMQDIIFSLATNSGAVQEAVLAFCAHPIIDKNRMVLLPERFPAIAGARAAPDITRFILPEEIELAQGLAGQRKYRSLVTAALGFLAVSLLFYSAALLQKHLIIRKKADLGVQQKAVSQDLSRAYAAKHYGIIERKTRNRLILEKFEVFLKKYPAYMYEVNSGSLQNTASGEVLQVVLLKGGDYQGAEAHLKRLFPKANIYESVAGEKSALIVEMPLE